MFALLPAQIILHPLLLPLLCYIGVSCSPPGAIITDPILTTGIPCRAGLILNHTPI